MYGWHLSGWLVCGSTLLGEYDGEMGLRPRGQSMDSSMDVGMSCDLMLK